MDLMETLTIVLIFLVFAILILAFMYWQMSKKDKENGNKNQSKGTANVQETKTSSNSGYTKLSIFDFMEFDKVEDNMIVQNNGQRYLMGIECEGINFSFLNVF